MRTPTRRRCRPRCAATSTTSTTSARSRSPRRAASGPRTTSRSTSPPRTPRTCRPRPTRCSDELDGLDSLAQTSSNLSESRRYVAVEVNRADAAAAGYSEVALGGYVSAAMQPQSAGSVVIDEKTLTIYLATEDPPTTVEELSALEVPTPTGIVPLDTLATVEEVDGPSSVTTVQGLRSATVSATPNDDDLGTASAEVSAPSPPSTCPPARPRRSAGSSADQAESFSQLGLALLAAILIVYIVMVATFRSLLQPLLLLVSVPFAATGAIALQVITGHPARRRLARRRAHARRHRGDERDRARRPREPVPRPRHERARRAAARLVTTSPADPHDGARHDLRAAARWRSDSPVTAGSSRSRSRSW